MHYIQKVNVAAIILLISTLIWWLFNNFIRPAMTVTSSSIHKKRLIRMPYCISCAFPDVSQTPEKNKCYEHHVDGWSVSHFLIYFFIGMFVPGFYLEMLILSIGAEGFEYMSGWRARWIIDPVVNMIGYITGVLFAKFIYAPKLFVSRNLLMSPTTSILILSALAVVLSFNRPCVIGTDFADEVKPQKKINSE
jgi:hypothetical protein